MQRRDQQAGEGDQLDWKTWNWRLMPGAFLKVVFYLLLVGIAFAILFVPVYLVTDQGRNIPFAGISSQIGDVITVSQVPSLFIAVLAVTFIMKRLIDRESFLSLGLHLHRGWLKDIAFGVALGFFLQALIFVAEWATGAIAITGFSIAIIPLSSLGLGLVIWFLDFVMVAIHEELMIRGYVLQRLEVGFGTPFAIFLSSVIFGLLHSTNPSASALSTLNLVIAGLFFAYAYIVTRSLWLPIALHFSWNFFEGPIFSFPVSGIHTVNLLQNTPVGSGLVTGGNFGPEAGLSGILAIFLGTVLIYLWAKYVRSKEELKSV
jgi:uncharacterized protein